MSRQCLIAYRRVSTARQGASGLGLEAQDAAIASYAQAATATLLRAYTEVETGKRADRPELARALADCKRSKAVLVIAKLDRLARNARFLLTLIESGVDVAFCDLPSLPPGAVGKFLLTQMAAVAELEAGLISERTKAALAAYKARGGLLGAARPGAHRLTGGANATAARRAGKVSAANAAAAYADLAPVIAGMRAEGLSLRRIAGRLNAEGHTTRRGKQWNAMQVRRVLPTASGGS
jgi:DNA invertase Pin-like site-specific DNA recombinase